MIELSMPLSKNFTLGELLCSPTAERDRQLKAEQENPPDEILNNLQYLVETALQPIRSRMAFPIRISSGYRCLLLNKMVGGSATSQHCRGEAAIEKSSHSLRVYAFDQARTFRRKALRNVREENKDNCIDRVIPVFSALIDCDEKNIYHRNHGQLAFAYKDQKVADWTKAKEELTIAMEIRDKNKIGGFFVYEFNRALCRIKTGDKLEEIKNDLEVALSGPKIRDWVKKPSQVYAPDLVQWLKTKRESLKDWIKERDIEVPE